MDTASPTVFRVDPCVKGIPGGTKPMTLAEIATQGWNVLAGDLPLPLAVLRRPALEHNLNWFQRLMDSQGALLAPHGKTHMSPQLFALQERAGAWGVTVATVGQALVYRAHGVKRILLANQLIGPVEIQTILEELAKDKHFDFYCLVDSLQGVRLLAEAAAKRGLPRPVQVLLEMGIPGQRCGVRTREEALTLARAIASAPQLSLRGVEAFEGLIMTPDAAESAGKVDAFLDSLLGAAEQMAIEGLFGAGPVLLTAGGTAYYDRVLERLARADRPDSPLAGRAKRVVRSGCYLFHDDLFYQRLYKNIANRSGSALPLATGPQPALEVWAQVLSRPEPARAVLGVGKRDISFDIELPLPLKWCRSGSGAKAILPMGEGVALAGLNDQHGLLNVPAEHPLQVGDRVALGVSHPCTTLDKWQVLMIVDANYTVVDAVKTFF